MAGKAHLVRISDFTGGESALYPYSAMPAKYSMLLQNCHVSATGVIEKVPGYYKVNTGGSAGVNLTSGFEFVKTDGTRILLVAGGGKIFKVTGNTLTEIKGSLSTSANVNFAAMNDICIMVNGVDAPMKYDGTTVSALGGTPPATAYKAHVHKGRLWLIERANVMLATHSALNNPEDFTTDDDAGYIDFKYILRRGDTLVDVLTYIDLIVFIFKDHVAVYSGNTPSGSSFDFSLQQLISGVGAVDSNLSMGLGTDLVMLYDEGLKSLKQIITTGNLSLGDVSAHINPTLRPLIALNAGGYFSIAHYPARAWLFLVIGDTVWVYSYFRKAWARMTSTAIQFVFATTDGKIYFCGNNYVYLLDEALGSFDGADIPMKWKTAWIPLSRAGQLIYPKIGEISVYCPSSTTFDVSAYTAQNYLVSCTSTQTLLDPVPDWDSLSPLDEDIRDRLRIPLFGRGRQMMFEITNTSSVAGIQFHDIVIQAIQGGF